MYWVYLKLIVRDVDDLELTEVHRFVYGNRDLTRVIADELGYVSLRVERGS